jgi:hypothetical protein
MRHLNLFGCVLSAVMAIAGCSQSGSTPVAAEAAAAPPMDTVVAEKRGVVAPVVQPNQPGTIVVPATNTAPATGAANADAALKQAQIAWALKEDAIRNDPNGQWAVEAKGSTAYNDAKGTAAFAAYQATGPANVEIYGNSVSAWSPKTADAGLEWLELQYARPVFATAVRVRESFGPGAIIKVELFDEQDSAHVVWTGTDPTKDLNYFAVEFPKTAFKTGRVKLTLATNSVRGWNQIDAVQLVGANE